MFSGRCGKPFAFIPSTASPLVTGDSPVVSETFSRCLLGKTPLLNSNVGNNAESFGFEVTVEEMAGGEVGGLTYSGWIPVNNPSRTLLDKPPITEPLTQGLDFPYFEAQQEEINGVSRPVNPWQESNSILERQQEGGIFPSLQLRLPHIALGGILLSLLGTAIIG